MGGGGDQGCGLFFCGRIGATAAAAAAVAGAGSSASPARSRGQRERERENERKRYLLCAQLLLFSRDAAHEARPPLEAFSVGRCLRPRVCCVRMSACVSACMSFIRVYEIYDAKFRCTTVVIARQISTYNRMTDINARPIPLHDRFGYMIDINSQQTSTRDLLPFEADFMACRMSLDSRLQYTTHLKA